MGYLKVNLTYVDENDYAIPILKDLEEHIKAYPVTEVKCRILGKLPIPKNW
jgi:hypothetical protein